MGFESLLGNKRLKDNLTGSLRRGRISHFYLISGPEGSGKKTLARLLAAAAVCSSADAPCLSCSACRKAMADTHPDIITVADPERKTVPIAMVRHYRDDIFIRPNEASRKVYIFPQELRPESQNALLKILEEPPQYGVFILLADNPEKLLLTVRSRCVELEMQSLPADILRQALHREFPDADTQSLEAAIARSGGWLGQAKQLLSQQAERSAQTELYLQALGTKDPLQLVQLLCPMEKWSRDKLIPELTQWMLLTQQALACRSGAQAIDPAARQLASQRSARELYEAVQALNKCIEYAQGNVSPGAICGWLTWALR